MRVTTLLLIGASLAAGSTAYLVSRGVSTAPSNTWPGAHDSVKPAAAGAASTTLSAVEQLLAQYPPAPDPQSDRRSALAKLDRILGAEDAAQQLPVQRFFHHQIEQAVQRMQATKVRSGATIWQIYNHGFVVRTASVTVCFDLVRAKYLDEFALSEQLMATIVGQCDVLFVSHVHADHAENFVARTFLEQGKPVVAPAQVGYREPLYAQITHLGPLAHGVQTLRIKGGRTILNVVVYPGHQGEEIDNNVILVTTPDGISVAHTGDQWDKRADFEWIDHVAEHFRVDILLTNDWTYDIVRTVRGFNPALVIPGHANELGHSLDKRQSYAFSFERKIGSGRFGGNESVGYAAPLVVMTWGESYHYEPSPLKR